MAEPVAATPQIEKCPASAPFFGFMGVTAAIVFASTYYNDEQRGREGGMGREGWGGREMREGGRGKERGLCELG
jgi:hypothetical protein